MKIAVCIPTYNRSQYLSEAILSIICQSEDGVDIHVFDDASTDNTVDICNVFKEKIIYHRNARNLGYVGNHNECLKLYQRYDWIGILQSDDRYEGKSVAEVKKLIKKYPSAGVVFSEINTMDQWGATYHFASPRERLFKKGESAVERCQRQLPCSTTFYRSEAIERVGGFDPSFPYSADEEYNARIGAHYDIIESGVALASYRRHPENTMLKTWKEPDFIENFEKMRIRMATYTGLPEKRAAFKARGQLCRDFLSCASVLTLNDEPDHADRYYRYVWQKKPVVFFNPFQLIKLILPMIPIAGMPLLKGMIAVKNSINKRFSKTH